MVSDSGSTRTRHAAGLRVTIVCTQAHWHGGEDQAALLADGLRTRGHACQLLARNDSEFARRMQTRGWNVETFSGRGRMPHSVWQIRQALKRHQPHVIYLNDPHALTAAGLAAVGLPIPLRVVARRVDFPLRSAVRYRHLADTIICVSGAVREVCLDAGVSADRLHVVHDGIDPSRLASANRQRGRASLQVRDSTRVLLTVAKLTDHKGHRFFLQALPAILREHPDTLWVVAGEGSLRQPLEDAARLMGLKDHVRFLGYRHDVPDLLAAADRLIVPSHLEGLCSSIVDAMLARCPVIATTAGGIPDLLAAQTSKDPAVAWLVPPRDSDALERAVRESFEQPTMTQRFVEQAYQRALNQFTADRMVERTLDVFQQNLHSMARAA